MDQAIKAEGMDQAIKAEGMDQAIKAEKGVCLRERSEKATQSHP